jgi:hypothetical protein
LKDQARKWASWVIVFLITARFTTSINCSRKDLRIVVEESKWKTYITSYTKNIFDVMWKNSHWVLCYMLWGFTTTININGNDAFVKNHQNLLKVSSYQSFSKMTRFENNVPWVFQMSYAQGIKVLIIFNDEYTHASTKES